MAEERAVPRYPNLPPYGPFSPKPEESQETDTGLSATAEDRAEQFWGHQEERWQAEEIRLAIERAQLRGATPANQTAGEILPEKAEKRDWTLLPFDALEEVVRTFQIGVQKHPGEDDWSQGSHPPQDLVKGLFRHLSAWMQKEDVDTEDDIFHMAAVAARALMILALQLRQIPGQS